MSKSSKKKAKTPLILKLMQGYIKIMGRLFPNFIGNYVYKLWFTTARYNAPEREQGAISSAHTESFQTQHGKIHIWSWGQGPVVLFLHGWSGRGTQVSAMIEPLTQAGYKVVSFDGPAHGKSEGKTTDIFKYREVTKQIIQKFGPLHSVITHSFGAMVFNFAYEQGLALEKAVFISPPSTLHTPVNHFQELLCVPPKAFEYYVSKLKNNYGQDIYEQCNVMQNSLKITAPVLVVHDEGDKVVPFRDGEEMAQNHPNATLLKTTELGHQKILYDSKTVASILNFIQSAKV